MTPSIKRSPRLLRSAFLALFAAAPLGAVAASFDLTVGNTRIEVEVLADLGIEIAGDRIRSNDAAPKAAIRRAIVP